MAPPCDPDRTDHGQGAHGRFVRWTAAAAAALLVAGCSGGTSGDGKDEPARRPSATVGTAPAARAGSPGLPASLTAQKLDWGRCEAT